MIKNTLLVLSLSVLSCQADEVVVAEKPTESKQEGINLFDGKTLEGWEAINPKNAKYWSVVDGIMEASNGDKKMPINTYLATTEEYGDFEFTCEFRLSGDHKTGLINSGIQYRSLLKKHKKRGMIISGYQADIGKGYWGDIYDEHRRGKLAKADTTKLFASEGWADDKWHTYKIICKGNHHQLFINGILTVDYKEEKAGIPSKGVIALQLHKGGVAKIQYKNIQLKKL